MVPVCVGIDLAWSARAPTGLAAVEESGALLDSASVRSDAEIDRWLDQPSWRPAVAAVDAPLVVTNATGQRPCEWMVSKEYGRFGASCHTSNLSRSWFNPPRGAVLAHRHSWDLDPAHVGGVDLPACIEVYPHPAMVTLFGLDRVIPYKGKRGRSLESRRAAFSRLLDHMRALGPLALESSDRWQQLVISVQQAARKADLDRVEDEIDAVFCAHLAWLWHTDRDSMRVFGDLATGYIITPS